ncbi:MAG: response regulator transcription factor [Nitriliruptorales bacterium]
MAASSTPITLLIVDDNSGIRTLLAALARRDTGLRVVGEAANGLEAVEVAGEYRPDVVILDIMMPEMDGIEAIPGILDASPESRIVMYSAYAESREAAMEKGAHGWCLKGEPWDAMAAEIRRVVSERDAVG